MAGMKRRVTREIGPLSLRAEVAPDSLDEEKRTVDVVWSTGARVMRGFWDRYWEELSLDPEHVRMGRLEGGAPLLDAHNGWALDGVIGVVESARLEGGQGIATVRFARAEDDEDADKVFRKVKDGVIRNVSVGYRVHRLEMVEDADDEIPVYRATDWEPYEISLVPMGADAEAGVRAAEGAHRNPCEFIELDERTTIMAKMKNDPQGGAPAAPAAPASDSQTAERSALVDEVAIRREAAEGERKRSAELRRVAKALDLPVEFAERHVAEGTELEAFRGLAIEERAKRPPIVEAPGEPTITGGEDSRDKWLRGATAWIVSRSGMASHVAKAAKERGETVTVDPGEFRGMSLLDLARESLERAGVSTRGMSKMQLAGEALAARGGGYAATGDFPILLENAMHKTLLAAYQMAPDTWTRFCKRGSVSDFRPHPRYRVGSFARLERVNEAGEFRNQAIADGEKESLTAETFGNIIAITRQAIVNDDLGAFVDLASRFGRAAKLSVEMDVYDLLKLNGGLGPAMADGNTLFHANHSNIGPGAALSVAALDGDAVVMAEQTDPSGNEILNLEPAILLVARGLKGEALVLNAAEFDPDSTDASRKPNKVRGLFDDVVGTARLGGTRRYMFADPGIAPVIEVAFLEGQSEPFLETKDGWRTDGTEMKVRLDYAVGAVDFRGAVTNAGV